MDQKTVETVSRLTLDAKSSSACSFHCMEEKTVETVPTDFRAQITGMKPGVNERVLMSFDAKAQASSPSRSGF
jgi:hypothetical protein